MFEPENIMKSLSEDMILPKFGKYEYYHETRSKPQHILFGFMILLLFLIKKLNC